MSVEMVENQKWYVKNTFTIRIVLGLIFLALLSMDGYFIYKNNQVSSNETLLMLTVQKQISVLDVLNDEVIHTAQDTNYLPPDFEKMAWNFETRTIDILEIVNQLGFRNPDSILTITNGLEVSQSEWLSLAEVVRNKRKEAYQNNQLIHSRTVKLASNYKEYANQIQTASIQNSARFHDLTFYLLMFSLGCILLIALGVHFLLFLPISTENKELSNTVSSEQRELQLHNSKVEQAKSETVKTQSLLKVKTAQVLKLQESLELAIAYSNKTQQDKSLIYFNIANDLSEYIKVMVLQQKIIENQTSMEGNENWITLSNTISQLNSMSGSYFNLAKNGQKSEQQGEVYLTQLFSEILVSMKLENGVSFEQVADLPTIRTDVDLLKRVLKPYFELMLLNSKDVVIKYTGKIDNTFCEVKFLGLQPSFEKELANLEKKDLADFSFEEFKVHMANKTIVERGGKYWMEQNSDKGLFTIYWSL